MLFNHIHDALAHVRELRRHVLERQIFRGYSGGARAGGGLAAILGALIMASPAYPRTVTAHIFGWGLICAAAAVLNYGAVLWWFMRLLPEDRELVTLKPTLAVLPPLAVGAILTFAVLPAPDPVVLFPVWMCLFGLVNLSSRQFLPRTVVYLGWYYIACGGIIALFIGELQFTNPWPMGAVFFLGELMGSLIFAKTRRERFSVG